MRKSLTPLVRSSETILKLLFILLCLSGGIKTFSQVIIINPPPVILAPTTTTVSSSANPSIAGQPVILSAAVTTQGTITPTGTVDFYDNTDNTDLTPGGVTISNGVATFKTGALSGNISITATYSGDAANLTSTSAAFTQTVNQPIILITPAFYATTTTLISNLNPSVAGSQAVTLTATVGSTGDANLTGKVDFYDNTDNKDLTPGGVAVTNGVATLTTNTLDFGDLNITATYGGDGNGNQPSTSNSLIQHVLLNITGIGIVVTSNQNTSKWGEQITLTAFVQTGVGIPTGTVIFSDNGQFLDSLPIDQNGQAILKTNLLTPGSHNITASWLSKTSNILTQTVSAPFPPTDNDGIGVLAAVARDSVIDNANKVQYRDQYGLHVYEHGSYYGQPVTFEATVIGHSGNVPTGSVKFFDGSTLLGEVGLDAGGNALLTTSVLSVGDHNISVFYSGSDFYEDQNGTDYNYSIPTTSVSITVIPSATSTTVTSSLNPSVTGQQQVTFTASVKPPAYFGNAIPPSGTVTFSIDGVAQSPVPLQSELGGLAFLNTSALPSGNHTITATYSGADNYFGSSFTGSSGSFKQAVTAVGSAILNFLGSSQSTDINTNFPNPLQFDIIDINPALSGGAAITFTAPASGASGTFSNGTNTITVHTTPLGSVGVASSGQFKANGIAGTYTVTATIPGMGVDEFTLTNIGPMVQITVGASVPGVSFTVDGTAYTSTQIFSWAPGSSHSLATTATQAGAAGTQYIFSGWSDATSDVSDNITVPSVATTYTANFNTQYQLTTASNPSIGGSASPASGTFYDAGEVVPLAATPQAGYQFSSWTGSVANSGVASTSITMNAPQSVTANFSEIPVTVKITIGTSVPGLSFTVDGTTYTSTQSFDWFPGDIHSIGTTGTQAGATGIQYVFTSWTNGGGGLITAPFSPTTYTANFKTQYQLTTTSNPGPGSSGSITPGNGSFYDAGSSVSVQANPGTGSCFSGFTGDLTGVTNPQSLTMDGPKAVSAAFVAQVQYYVDNDGDGYGSTVTAMLCSSTAPAGYSTNNSDCDDNNTAINPATVWYQDADNDGYSDGATKTQCSRPVGYKLSSELSGTAVDCNDSDPALKPTTVWYKDADNDGYSDGTTQTQCQRPGGYKLASELTATSGDCNDADNTINPGSKWYKDADNDGYSDGTTVTQCAGPAGYKLASALIATTGDCNDADATVWTPRTYYRDADGDGYGNPSQPASFCSSTPPAGYVSNNSDCNDANASVNPGVPLAILGASTDIAVLAPPNHQMRDVMVNYTTTDDCGSPVTTLSVKSSDPITGTGDGDASPDWIIVDNHHVKLRAEQGRTGSGRIYTITITATDASGHSTTSSVTVRVAHNIVSPPSGQPFRVGSTVNFTGVFWDKPTNKHTANWLVNDNTTVKGTLTEPTATKNGTVAGSYKFNTPGVYKLRMNTVDQNNVVSYANTNGDLEEIVVIYDPNGGYAYGGGWFNSPAGALSSDPQATGKVSFGFSVNYYKGATTPKGETQFQFQVGDLEYNALNFDYLSVSGYKAVFRGSGKIIGGQSGINFIMYVIDGAFDGTNIDKVRIKIYNKNTGQIYYDNQPGASDAADPVTPTGAGSTVVISKSPVAATTTVKQDLAKPEQAIKENIEVNVMPNPAYTNFKMVVKGNYQADEIKLVVFDMFGRVIEQKILSNKETIQLGDNYRPGVYIASFTEGKQTKQVKLVKLSE